MLDVIGVTSTLVLYVLLIAAVIGDLHRMKISNRLILTGCFAGLCFSYLEGGTDRFVRALPNIFFPVILLFLFYLLGAIGSGDIKLFSLIGSFIDYHDLSLCIVCTFILAAAVSLVQLLAHRRLVSGLKKAFFYLNGLLHGDRKAYSCEENACSRIHFSICILAGMLIVQSGII